MFEQGVTPPEMAKLFHVTDRSWHYWMKDPEGSITVGRLRVIAAKLNTTPAALLKEG